MSSNCVEIADLTLDLEFYAVSVLLQVGPDLCTDIHVLILRKVGCRAYRMGRSSRHRHARADSYFVFSPHREVHRIMPRIDFLALLQFIEREIQPIRYDAAVML